MSLFKDKTLLITGGTGSFGNAVLKRFLDSDIKEIRIFSRDEKKQDDMRHHLQNKKVKFYIGDVRDKRSVDGVMNGVENSMSANENNLIWIDLEMTGLDPERDRIIEIATLVTDANLNILAEGPTIAVHQSDEQLALMDDWNVRTHTASGLVERVKASTMGDREAELATLEFLKQWVPAGKSPICGNSIGQDRRFLFKYMPELEAYFHYRYLDVSTLKELARRWKPEILDGFTKQGTHQAMDDIRESVAELAYYREHFIKL